MRSVPLQGLDFLRHAAESGSVVMHDVLVDLAGESLVVGVAGEVAFFEHLEPVIGFLGCGNEIFSEGFLERRARSAAFVPLSFEVELEGLPHNFKGELEALDGGVADEFAFRKGHGFGKADGALAHGGLSLGESFFAHGLKFRLFRLVRIAASGFAASANWACSSATRRGIFSSKGSPSLSTSSAPT